MTNGDVIRQMSNEQLADFLAGERERLARHIFRLCGLGVERQIVYLSIFQWLNQEAK